MYYPNFTKEIQIGSPSVFVREHQRQLLPTWADPIVSTAIILQPSRFPVTTEHPELETEKERLREQFLRWAFPRVCQLRDRDGFTDLIDPRSGYPLFSTPGEIRHDDVAMIAAVLGWEIVRFVDWQISVISP